MVARQGFADVETERPDRGDSRYGNGRGDAGQPVQRAVAAE
jgi:hypothetical protein